MKAQQKNPDMEKVVKESKEVKQEYISNIVEEVKKDWIQEEKQLNQKDQNYIRQKIEAMIMKLNKHRVNETSLSINNKEALKTYKLHGKNMDMKDIEWRGWQRDLR